MCGNGHRHLAYIYIQLEYAYGIIAMIKIKLASLNHAKTYNGYGGIIVCILCGRFDKALIHIGAGRIGHDHASVQEHSHCN